MSIPYENLSDDLKNKLQNYNNLVRTLEFLTQQRFELERGLRDAELAIGELDKTDSSKEVYKSIGGIMVKSERDRLLDEKKSQKASIELKLKTITQREERTKTQLETLRIALEKDFKDQGISQS
ncbi:MAG: prefoldin subunit [Candidatus Lokiarchaeota archaeon]|nr:prefoldin subunit [Candidatus Lokiarchaeota archaeon]